MQLRNGLGDMERKNSTEEKKARPSVFLSEEASTEMMGWMLRALGSKRFHNGDHSGALEHAWIFQFIDIIYVGTTLKISHIIGTCGRGIDVYILAFSYFAIMFSSRCAFDVYTCISGANGILHLIAFCFFGMGVFVMTVNIASISTSSIASSHVSELSPFARGLAISDSDITYGDCKRSIDYDIAFASAFIFTRGVLVVMYGLYFFVFHESNVIGMTPNLDTLSQQEQSQRPSDASVENDMESAVRMSHIQLKKSISIDNNSHYSGSTKHSSEISNPLTQLITHRTSFVVKVANAFRESVVQRHFCRIFLLKVAPVILSSLIMTAMLGGASPVYVLPIVAGIEFVGDFLPSYFITNPADWAELNPQKHFAQERLGLFFMLVLGEAVLGFCTVNYNSQNSNKVYRVMLFTFLTIFTVGMQYFEPLQSYTKPEGPHPLDIQKLSPVYVWLVCLISFFMLIAANGMVEVYDEIADKGASGLNERDLYYEKQKVSNGLGTVMLLIIATKLLDKVYYRERILPDPFFSWLNKFYTDAEEQQKEQNLHRASASHHNEADLRSSIVSTSTDGFNMRASMKVVAKEDVSIGIRKIRPLTAVKILASGVIYAMWHFDIASEDYMLCTTVLVVMPSLAEVLLEVRNFVKQQRRMRTTSIVRSKPLVLPQPSVDGGGL